MASAAQITANIDNAQHSTGPTSESGKLASKLNAFKHGLTSQLVVLPSEDMVVYEGFRSALIESLAPAGPEERQLAQRIADTNWRINRVPAQESNIFALALQEPLPEHLAAIEDSPARNALIETNALITHERHLRNLHLQEQRLYRELRRLMAELTTLQTARLPAQLQQFKSDCFHTAPAPLPQETAPADPEPQSDPTAAEPPFDLSEFGFDFANTPTEELNSLDRRIRQMHQSAAEHNRLREDYRSAANR